MFSSLPKPLQSILQRIQELKEIRPGSTLEDYFFNSLSKDDFKCFATYNHPPEESYGRHTIYQDNKIKVLFMTWCPGDFTAIHNHGPAEWGFVYAFDEITHRVYEQQDNQISLKNSETFKAGQLARVSSGLIHMMGNTSAKAALSLHIYGIDNTIPIDHAKVYQPEQSKVVETCGPAFLNLNPQFILSEYKFDTYSSETLLDYHQLTLTFYKRINKEGQLNQLLERLHSNT
jgi:cysteine dioxygenase